jgi:Permease for cytosine/purines, uracil, thiamine, allantoin
MGPVDAASEVEKARRSVSPTREAVNPAHHYGRSLSRLESNFKTCEQVFVKYNMEIRGIQRVEEHEKVQISWLAYLQAFGLWVSVNLAPNNITLGMLGPAVYELSFRDASLCAVFGAIIGSVPVAWIATWGAVSGLRAMVG